MVMCILHKLLKLENERVYFQDHTSQQAVYFFDRKTTPYTIMTKNFLGDFFLFEKISHEAQGVIIFIKSVTFGSKSSNPRTLL